MTHSSSPVKLYLAVYVALLVLLGLSVSAAELDLGRGNFVVSAGIATAKAVLIVLLFMHVRHGTALIKLVIGASVLWLAIMFTLTSADYGTRHWEHERQRLNRNIHSDASNHRTISPKPADGSKPL